ncbi:hypothetical protein CPB84DRAFT_1845235 [Gymnopilus junonius]|uniref:BBC1/AIM3 cysteine proteinase-fold domain-containing protein n=1 Tax=Gymnopilus junonius TaxID=109634 RepID=A0A9P5NUU4_GYMJU|nr:hypothetical protein CPB84DRAFT_1845235 [Gymnopilus junonius]
MPSFADLKARASKTTSAGVEKLHNVRDRNTSVPMKKTNWDPYSGAPPPPPPPPRSLVNKSNKPALAPLPPPPSRTGSATSSSRSSSVAQNAPVSPAPPPLPSRGPSSTSPPQLPPRSNKGPAPPPPPPRSSPSLNHNKSPPPPGPSVSKPPAAAAPPPIARSTRPGLPTRHTTPPTAPSENDIDWANLSPEDKEIFFSWLDEFFANFRPPPRVNSDVVTSGQAQTTSHARPPLRSSSKPVSWSRPQVGTQSKFILSHPPATKHGSAALDLAYYFAPTAPWTGAWYHSTTGKLTVPPPLVGNNDHTYMTSWRSLGSDKTRMLACCSRTSASFGVQSSSTQPDPKIQEQRKRHAVYLPPPKPLGNVELVEAHETYGESIALFAESFLGSGQFCARGECWDLANEGKATNGGREMVGRWRGGDDRVRRGDIIEWRRVRISMRKGPYAGGHATLGDPDHTAVIVSDIVPSSPPKDGASLSPSDLGVIVVVEQSAGKLPSRQEYDLSGFEEGEVWIYRPIGMQAYLGISDLTAEPPEDLHGLQSL